MFSSLFCVLFWIFSAVFQPGTCGEIVQPYLALYTPGDLEYTDVVVKRVGDNLTLVCELKGTMMPRMYVWNYVPQDNSSTAESPYTTSPRVPALSSQLTKQSLQLSDSGHYVCSAPPFSATKFILVQGRGPKQCARGAFWCGKHCVLAAYVCDGFKDCLRGEDEAPELCLPQPCERPDRLNCSSGRCISTGACCAGRAPCPAQPACCDEHPRYSRLEGFDEYPPLFEDRHAHTDEYGFIQSTIYTVTACALIFMIAVVLLVSAVCKMHMKRAALRGYTNAARYAHVQTSSFPPCYEASRLLEAARQTHSPPGSPQMQCGLEHPTDVEPLPGGAESPLDDRGFGLTRLTQIFNSRYRQVPTQCVDVELRPVVTSRGSPPARAREPLHRYRSPTFCDLNADNAQILNCGRDLNYMATPVEFYRRRTLRSNLDRVIDQIHRPRPLTLQLGRFQLSIPRFRRQSPDRRPDTPNIAELDIDDLDFVRLNSNDTYTLNGRTIRLLGANFENYPMNDGTNRPPPYTEAMRYKLFGPPPEYLSRDALNTEREEITPTTEDRARNNVEMPPCYDDVTPTTVDNDNNVITVTAVTENDITVTTLTDNNNVVSNDNSNNVTDVANANTNDVTQYNNANNDTNSNNSLNITDTLSSVIDNLPAIDSDVNANDNGTRYNDNDGRNDLTNHNTVNA